MEGGAGALREPFLPPTPARTASPQVSLEMLQEADSPAEVTNHKTKETEEGPNSDPLAVLVSCSC